MEKNKNNIDDDLWYIKYKLNECLELIKQEKIITVAEKIKNLALFLDILHYGKSIKEIREEI
jgi:hypothetical protein